MDTLNRRQFLAATTAAAVGVALFRRVPLALAAEAAPATGAVDVGPLGGFPADGVTDTFAKTSKFFLVRRQGKLYAPSSVCTHKHCILKTKDDELACGCHGSRFSQEGTVLKGPARLPLVRYAISVNDQKHVLVDTSRSFEEDKWADPASFIQL